MNSIFNMTKQTAFKQLAGYTIIELLIVIAVIALLSTLVVVRFARYENSQVLENVKALIRADTRAVITYAQTGRVSKDYNGIAGLPKGYGIRFQPGLVYELYAEFDGNKLLGNGDDPSLDNVIKTVDLLNDELVNNLEIQSCAPVQEDGFCDLYVALPSGEIFFNGAQSSPSLQVNLYHSRRNEVIALTINRISGQIN